MAERQTRTGRVRQFARAVGYCWAAPSALAGLMLFLCPCWLLGQVRPLGWREGAWEWEVTDGSWFWRRYTGRGWSGTALAWCVFFSPGQQHVRRIAIHERRHVWQSLCLGPFYFPAYALLLAATGYRRHPMERDARAWEARCQ